MRGIYDPTAAAKQRADAALAERQMLIDALMACHEAMSYMSEYDIPITLPDQVKFALAKAGAIK